MFIAWSKAATSNLPHHGKSFADDEELDRLLGVIQQRLPDLKAAYRKRGQKQVTLTVTQKARVVKQWTESTTATKSNKSKGTRP